MYIKKISILELNKQGFYSLGQICEITKLGYKAIRRYIPGYLAEGRKCRFYKLDEAKEIVSRMKNKTPEIIKLKSICKWCHNEFEYEKKVLCNERNRKNYAEGKIRKFCTREWCGCKKRYRSKSDIEKQILRDKMNTWWSNVSYQKKTAMRKKQSTKKKQFWARNLPFRKHMSETMSKALKGVWYYYNTEIKSGDSNET